MIIPLTSTILSYLLALVAIAFFTLMERKFLGYFQLRKGPNKPIFMGLPVPFADAIKLFLKEQNKPIKANKTPFLLAPILSLSLAIILWILFPHRHQSLFLPLGAVFFLCISRINVYATFIAGWYSNSKFSLLGRLRGVAQTISYEVRISLIILTTIICINSMELTKIIIDQKTCIAIIFFPLRIIWFISSLAETNRTPFDFAEGESELVSGFNTEYRRRAFALIFIAEYINILFIRIVTSTILLQTPDRTNFILIIKTTVIAALFVLVRGRQPRIRYDILIYLTWKCFLPIILVVPIILLVISSIMN